MWKVWRLSHPYPKPSIQTYNLKKVSGLGFEDNQGSLGFDCLCFEQDGLETWQFRISMSFTQALKMIFLICKKCFVSMYVTSFSSIQYWSNRELKSACKCLYYNYLEYWLKLFLFNFCLSTKLEMTLFWDICFTSFFAFDRNAFLTTLLLEALNLQMKQNDWLKILRLEFKF